MNPLVEVALNLPMPISPAALTPMKGIKNKKVQMLLANERILAWRKIAITRKDKQKDENKS